MERLTIHYDSCGETGNIFWILGELQKGLRKQRRINDFNEIRDRVFEARSYKEALAIIGEEATLIDHHK